ncbi:Rieske (2Fe-2S) protein [Cecembia rubra]|uniref:3-phenylpropionate/trans-cinnamate dioxygenase ferredoxin subunit n=1 Tax=Cecembia rubra TaxID=1485585 RepID=A0A2P8E4E3_9BACT|nr:Rieske 2Fe-2S domain-containing protein [Cecembia rubra]PSL04287.1 3-phenylpropionate/trans-cinnamate dioxygenase ferredoxin subunit [Cecembia rubra]
MKTFILGRTKEEVLGLLREKEIKTVALGERKICLTRIGEEYFAFEQNCPHRKANLGQGYINNFQEIICPLHAYRFDLKSGKVSNANCPDLQVFKTQISDNGLKIFI